MHQITVHRKTENDHTIVYSVDVRQDGASTHHTVTVTSDYLTKLGAADNPDKLIKRSFEFLLHRESNESIFREFDLSVIQTYFPNYESEIKQ